MKKFELTTEFKMFLGKKLFRIKALINFDTVKAGELGGYIEKEENLDHSGNAWVYGNAQVHGDAWVCGNADILIITGLGTVHRTTTVFKTEKEIMISCGCFYGTLSEFRKQVVYTRDGKVQKEYLKFSELIEIYFGVEDEKADVNV